MYVCYIIAAKAKNPENIIDDGQIGHLNDRSGDFCQVKV